MDCDFTFRLCHLFTGMNRCEISFMTHQHLTLTTLPNRYHFFDLIEREAKKHGAVSLYLVDVMRFSDISSAFDYRAGDELLVKIANQINHIFHNHLLLGRVSGDIFGLLFHGESSDNQLRERYFKLIEHFKTPIFVNETAFIADFNVGCSVKTNEKTDVMTLVSRAESALKLAKGSKLENFKIVSERNLSSTGRGLALKADLTRALNNEELELYLQPKVDLQTLEIVGSEALLRWNHPLDGLLFPGALIEAAESYNLMNELGYWTIHRAISMLASLNMSGINLPISVNLSPSQLYDSNLSPKIKSLLKYYSVQPTMIELELTEDVALSDSILVKRQLDEIRAMGISLSMDDFGKGYSNLSLIKDLDLQAIKIDKAFVLELKDNPVNLAIIQATKIIGDSKNCYTVAEGIETLEHLSLLADAGVHMGQGFLFSKAIPLKDFIKLQRKGDFKHLLKDNSRNRA